MALYKGTVVDAKVSGSHSDFPEVVLLEDLPASFWSTVTNGGGDIRTYDDESKTTELPREVVSCDTGTETGELHFKNGTLAAGSIVYIDVDGTRTEPASDSTYGSEAVWGSNYLAVYHLNATTGDAVDSTGNSYDMTEQNSPGSMTGQIGGARTTDEANSRHFSTTSGILGSSISALTFQGWWYLDTASENGGLLSIGTQGGDDFDNWFQQQTDDTLRFGLENDSGTRVFFNTTSLTTSIDSWNMIHGTWDGSTMQSYIDGVQDANSDSFSGSITDTGTYKRINRAGGNYLDGGADEIRIRASALSPNWITTEYNNQSDPGAFRTWEEVVTGVKNPLGVFGGMG